MYTPTERVLVSLAAERDAHLERSAAFERRGLCQSARFQRNAALAVQQRIERLRSLLDARASR